MKKISLFLLAILLTSCSKDDGETATDNGYILVIDLATTDGFQADTISITDLDECLGNSTTIEGDILTETICIKPDCLKGVTCYKYIYLTDTGERVHKIEYDEVCFNATEGVLNDKYYWEIACSN